MSNRPPALLLAGKSGPAAAGQRRRLPRRIRSQNEGWPTRPEQPTFSSFARRAERYRQGEAACTAGRTGQARCPRGTSIGSPAPASAACGSSGCRPRWTWNTASPVRRPRRPRSRDARVQFADVDALAAGAIAEHPVAPQIGPTSKACSSMDAPLRLGAAIAEQSFPSMSPSSRTAWSSAAPTISPSRLGDLDHRLTAAGRPADRLPASSRMRAETNNRALSARRASGRSRRAARPGPARSRTRGCRMIWLYARDRRSSPRFERAPGTSRCRRAGCARAPQPRRVRRQPGCREDRSCR